MAYAQMPPPGYPPSPYGRGPAGEVRPLGMQIVLFCVTLGIWGWYWAYKVAEEMKRYANVGIGGVAQMLLWIFIAPVSGFLIPSDIQAMYEAEGEQSPVTAMTGLWFFPGCFILVGPIIWYVQVQNAMNDFWGRRQSIGGYGQPGPSWGPPPAPPTQWGPTPGEPADSTA